MNLFRVIIEIIMKWKSGSSGNQSVTGGSQRDCGPPQLRNITVIRRIAWADARLWRWEDTDPVSGHILPRSRSRSRRSRFEGLPSETPSNCCIAFRSCASFSRDSRLASVSR